MKKLKIIFLIFLFGFYLYNLCPTIFVGDSPEIITATHTLGIAHPPGYPAFTVISRFFVEIFPFGNPAYRSNFVNAFFLLLCICLMFEEIPITLILYFSLSPLVFKSALYTEVFTLNLLFAVIVVFLLKNGKRKHIFLASFIFGIGLANHQTLVLLLPGVFYLLHRKKFFTKENISYLLVFFLLGFSINFFLLIRAKQSPVLNWGEPVNFKKLLRVLLRKDYGTFALTGSHYKLRISSFFESFVFGFKFFGPFFVFFPLTYFFYKKTPFLNFLFISFFFTGPFFYFFSGLHSSNAKFIEAIIERFYLLPSFFAILIGAQVLKNLKFKKIIEVSAVLLSVLFIFENQKTCLKNFYSLSDFTDTVLRQTSPSDALVIQKGAVGDDLIFALAYKKFVEGRPSPQIFSPFGAIFPRLNLTDLKKFEKKYFFAFSKNQVPANFKFENFLWKEKRTFEDEIFWRISGLYDYRVRSFEILYFYFNLLEHPSFQMAEITNVLGEDIDWLLVNVGSIWQSLRKTKRAKVCYEKAIKLNPSLAEAFNNLAVLYYHRKNYAGAYEYFRKAVRIQPDSTRFYNLGLSQVQLGRIKEAVESFKNSLRYNPLNYRAFNELGLIELNKGNFKKALFYFEKGLKINPQDGNLRFNFKLAKSKLK